MIGLCVSTVCLILFFVPLEMERERGKFVFSEVLILMLAIFSLLSTYFTVDRFLRALRYIQYPPPYWVEDPPTVLFELYFFLTFLPLVVTTFLFLSVYVYQRRILQVGGGIVAIDICRILIYILVVEVIFWFLASPPIANINSTWEQDIPLVLIFFIVGTFISFVVNVLRVKGPKITR